MRIYNLGILEIMGEDLEIKRGINSYPRLTFHEAEEIASSMGEGWRFPTVVEMLFLKEYYAKIGVLNFNRLDAYWLSDRIINGERLTQTVGGAFYFWMGYGGIPKSERLRARLVRNIK